MQHRQTYRIVGQRDEEVRFDGNIAQYDFFVSGLAASQTELVVQRTPNGSATLPDYRLLADGYLLGVVVEIDHSSPTTQLTVVPRLDNIKQTGLSIVPTLGTRRTSNVAPEGGVRVHKSSVLSVVATTSGGWTAANVHVRVFVGYDQITKD